MGVSENRGPQYSTLNNRILIIRTPNKVPPNFRKLPYFMGAKEPYKVRGSGRQGCRVVGKRLDAQSREG